MANAKRVLFLVSGILSIIGIVSYIIIGCVMFGLAGNEAFISEFADSSSGVTPEEAKEIARVLFMGLGIMFIFFGIMCIINAILCFKGRNSNSKNIMILNIVFGVLSCIELNILAAIFGIVVGSKKPKQVEE
jgi:sulfite exporter TauE/SafE